MGNYLWAPARQSGAKVLATGDQKGHALVLSRSSPIEQNHVLCHQAALCHQSRQGKSLCLCFDLRQQADLRDSRREEIVQARLCLREGKTIKSGLEKSFDQHGKVIIKALDQGEEFDGDCIFSTRPMVKAEPARLCFDKETVEKAFRSLEGVVELQPIRHWLSQRAVAHVFIGDLAYLLPSSLKSRLKSIGISQDNVQSLSPGCGARVQNLSRRGAYQQPGSHRQGHQPETLGITKPM